MRGRGGFLVCGWLRVCVDVAHAVAVVCVAHAAAEGRVAAVAHVAAVVSMATVVHLTITMHVAALVCAAIVVPEWDMRCHTGQCLWPKGIGVWLDGPIQWHCIAAPV